MAPHRTPEDSPKVSPPEVGDPHVRTPRNGGPTLECRQITEDRVALTEGLITSRQASAELKQQYLETQSALEDRDQAAERLRSENKVLAQANARAANLAAELEERNDDLWNTTREVARANAHAAELVATIEIKEEEIQRLNRSLSLANARAADLLADREIRMDELRQLNELHLTEIAERAKIEIAHERVIEELTDALAKIRTLKGLIPVCAWCSKIRDDSGYWGQLESYLEKNSEAKVSHGICPSCSGEFAPDDS